MTRVWTQENRDEDNNINNDRYNSELSETDFNTTEVAEGHSDDKAEGYDEKLHYLNGNEKHFEHINNGGHKNDENEPAEKSENGDSFFGLHWDKDLEKELAEQSKMMLKMIYFFQVLPFYILQFTSGMALGYPSILVPQLIAANNSAIVMDNDTKGWIVSLDYGITAIVALMSGQLQMMFGPKKTSLLACIPICLSWLMMALAQDISAIYGSRILVGLGNGILTSSVYIVEVVSANRRGSVVMIETAFRSLGLIVVYLLGALIKWQTLAWLVTPLPIFAFIYGYFIPESPIFLSQMAGYTQIDGERGPNKERSLSKTTWGDWKSSTKNTLELYKRRDVRIPLMLLVVVILAQQCSGMKIIQGYAVEIFADAFTKDADGLVHGQEVDNDAYWSAVVMGFVRFVATLLAAMYINNFGRKTMYFVSTVLTIIFQIAFGIIDVLDVGYACKAVPIFFICGQVFCLQLGLQTFPNLLSSELFPNDARSRCKGFIRAVSAMFSFIMLKLFPYLETHIGLYGSFWLLASILFTILPFIYLFVPEAKDVDLNNIGGFFKPVVTTFYVEFPLRETKVPTVNESFHRIQMIQNSFGSAGKLLNTGERVLLAEGILLKRGSGKTKRRHFFLFDDLLVWGSVIRENINYIRQRTIPLESLHIEDIKDSNAWKLSCPEKSFVLEALNADEKCQWMLLIHFARSRIPTVKQAKNFRFQGSVESGESDIVRDNPKKRDIVINATDIISKKSNKAIDAFYQHMENGKSSTEKTKF